MNPEPASPDHSVPSQSKTATLGDNPRTASRNSDVLKRLTETTLLTESTTFPRARTLTPIFHYYDPFTNPAVLILRVRRRPFVVLPQRSPLFVIPRSERSRMGEESAVVFPVLCLPLQRTPTAIDNL
jgi:hypothetical protein